MKSMTGYGKSVLCESDRQITVEIKSVNNRYLEISCRLPKSLSFVEDAVKREIKKRLSRGTVDVYFGYENNSPSGKTITVDENLIRTFAAAAQKVSEVSKLENNYTVSDLMRVGEIIKVDANPDDEELVLALVSRCTAAAVENLESMRCREGETIRADLLRLAESLESSLKKARARVPHVVAAHAEKLRTRIEEILGGVEIDETRLANEVAFFADKADINEEMSRLDSHLAQFRLACSDSEPQGRNLDFLAQEIGREINTMGSKSNDGELTALVLFMKNELEKIKEQIRNVE